MSKKYIRVRAGERRGFPMRIFIEKAREGFIVSQFNGKVKAVIKSKIKTHYEALILAKEWQEHFRQLGRGARVIDFSFD